MDAQPSPVKLVREAVEAEDASFETFFAAEWPRLFRSLLLLTGNKHEAEDVTQGAFLKLLERWDNLQQRRRHDRRRRRPGRVPDADQGRLLSALLVRDGRDGADVGTAVTHRGRVPVRYPAGRRQHLVTTLDAHVWVEVLFPRHGWLQFEPEAGTDHPNAQPGTYLNPGPTATEPTVAPEAGRDGLGLPPEAAVPSTPEEGEHIAHFLEPYGPTFVFVYADGRVITQEGGLGFLTERHLTPEGVELVRSGAIQADDLWSGWDGIHAELWEDPEIKPYVPSSYAVCYWMDGGDSHPGTVTVNDGYEYPSTVLRFFPAQARAILRGELTHGYVAAPGSLECSKVTTQDARALVRILSGVRVEDSEGDEIYWEMQVILPHGVPVGYCSPNPCG